MTSGVVVLGEVSLPQWRVRHQAGAAQGTSPFGVDALESRGFRLHSHPHGQGRLRTKLRDVVEHRTGLVLDQPLSSCRAVAHADLVLALLEQHAVVPAALKRRGVPPYAGTPLVALTCWLADDLATGTPQERDRWLDRLGVVELLLVLSRHQVPVLVDAGFSSEQVLAVPFGIEEGYFTAPDADAVRDIDVLAVGQDRGRDYGTLFRAVAGTGIATRLVCKPDNLERLSVPDEVTVSGPVPISTYRDLLRRAKVVVVPTRELAYPTGQTVALEAMASGAAVVATGTAAMGEYLDDGVDSLLVGVGDDRGLRDRVSTLLGDPQLRAELGTRARATVVGSYTAHAMWNAVADALHARFDLPAGDRPASDRPGRDRPRADQPRPRSA